MGYSVLSFLFAWTLPTKEDRHHFREFLNELDERKKIIKVHKNYPKIIKNIQKRFKNRDKIKVIFLVNEIAKWKCQSLYDEIKNSDIFEPCIALTIKKTQQDLSLSEEEIIERNHNYFKNRNMDCVIAYDTKRSQGINLKKFNPQIVFYQQPWDIEKRQTPFEVSKYALICYVPYYVPNHGILKMDCGLSFHKYLYRYYVLNEEWVKLYREYTPEYLGKYCAVGHTILDRISTEKKGAKHYVIYAPHWSIRHEKNKNSENYSTFDIYGQKILEYAKSHPEINWVFKPHPTLKHVLQKITSIEEAENYYKEWESFVEVSYADYIDMFKESSALITDCGSFLIEYFYTGKPIIHLISKYNLAEPLEVSQKIMDTFYKVTEEDELYKVFDDVLINKNDKLKQKRMKVLSSHDELKGKCADKIMEDLKEIVIGE